VASTSARVRRHSERATPPKPVYASEVISVRVGQDDAKAPQTRGEQFRATMLALARTLPTVPGTLTFIEPEDEPEAVPPAPPHGWSGDLLSCTRLNARFSPRPTGSRGEIRSSPGPAGPR
jgi:hypothetical protein